MQLSIKQSCHYSAQASLVLILFLSDNFSAVKWIILLSIKYLIPVARVGSELTE